VASNTSIASWIVKMTLIQKFHTAHMCGYETLHYLNIVFFFTVCHNLVLVVLKF